MLKEGDILYVDKDGYSYCIYEIITIFLEKNAKFCDCYTYFPHKQEKRLHIKLSLIERYIYIKNYKSILIDEFELAKFLLER